jgi:CheY-like chemotaxis protein
LNIGNNAVKFTGEYGKISINVNLQEQNNETLVLKFSIRDTGIGMTKEQQLKVFQSFSQADSSTTRQYGGSGLGLAISKNLIELMGGKIWVESEVDVGSTFYFTINLILSDEKSSLSENSLSDSNIDEAIKILRGSHILLAEDNEFNQVLVEEILDAYNMTLEIAFNGQQAIDFLNSDKHYDGVLMDCQMPVMDGYAATKILRKQDKFINLPIIALTANVMKGDKEDVLKSGMDDYIAKPIDEDEMLVTMAKWIKHTI